ncbi:MAG: hypothetical protein Q8L94_17200 [Parvibaculum sp.]|uniref:hypothetical protein n=1 Tax=Parvibaculum sp. TaxID=2024848 RepID=UPI00272F65E8|nr:hypothetical protein [Parvibaculum sp.]MDP1628856.1 hypothetical protein [Parvibaculum sp.]MDP2148251.1 hypothetical protein [Parvibaculum sp.]
MPDIEPASRKEMRHRTRDLLIAGDVLGGNWFASRRRPAKAKDLPVGLVYTPSESMISPMAEQSIPHFDNSMRLAVEVHAGEPGEDEEDADEALDDTLDAIADEIRELLLCSPAWLEGVAGVASVEIEKQPESGGEIHFGAVRLVFQLVIGESYWQPDLDTPLRKIGLRPVAELDGEGEPVLDDEGEPMLQQFGFDMDGDGKADVEAEFDIPQD